MGRIGRILDVTEGRAQAGRVRRSRALYRASGLALLAVALINHVSPAFAAVGINAPDSVKGSAAKVKPRSKSNTTQSGTGLQFVPVVPCRVADTRNAAGPFGGPELGAQATREFDIPQSACGIPSTAVAYSLNVTVVPNVKLDYLTLWPTGQPQPNASTLNSVDGRIKANAAVTPAGTNGGVDVYVSDATNVILDIDGYFVPAGAASALAFYPLTPCRIVDTRNASGPLGGPFLGAGTSRSFPVQSSMCNIPGTAQAYSLNVTALPHTTLDYLTTWPTGESQPNVSTLNALTGAITANAAIVPAGNSASTGAVSIYVSQAADVILDVNGYFAPPATGGLSLYTTTPCRVLDTRNTSGVFSGILPVAVQASTCAPPSTAQAYVLNATIVPPGALDYLTLWPVSEAQPNVSTLNALDGAIASNMAIVPNVNGSVDAFASNPTQLILDISSYFAPATAAVITPAADPGGPYTGIPGGSIPFNGADSSDPFGETLTYLWDFGDGSTATGVSPVHTYAAVGSYTVTLTVTDTSGLANTAKTTAAIAVQSAPAISSFTPTTGPIGTVVTVTGTNLGFSGLPPQVALAQQGGGTLTVPVDAFTATSLTFVVPPGATTGAIAVAVGSKTATSASSFTVTTSSSFTLRVTPSSGTVIQGQSVALAATISSTNGFSGLAALSVAGLPAGMTGTFQPTSIAVGQVSVLTISAPASQATGTANLTITAATTINNQPFSQTATPSVQVAAISTSFLGRTVVDNAQETPIAGVTIKFLGVTDKGNTTGCSGTAISDGGGNFSLANLPAACVGPQLISYDGSTATAPAGKYAGVNLSYTLVSGKVVTSPVLIHLPRIDNAETVQVTQKATTDQVFYFHSIPGLKVTVYAGTTFSLDDGSQPSPFPLVAMDIPIDRLPDQIPTSGMLTTFIVAFQPANAVASQPVAVTFPNPLSYAPGTTATLVTLDPTRGYMVPFGTATVSNDGTTFIPNADPTHTGHLYGLVHFDWHGPMAPPPPSVNPGGGGNGPGEGGNVDLASGLEVARRTDITIQGGRAPVSLTRTYRTLSTNPGPFGIGTSHNYNYQLAVFSYVQGQGVINLVMPDGNQLPFYVQPNGTLINSTIPALQGTVLSVPSSGVYSLKWKNGTVFLFQVSTLGPRLAYLDSITDLNGNTITLTRPNTSQPDQIGQIVDPSGRKLFTFAYDNSDRVASITDILGRTLTYAYNSQGTLATVTDLAGGVTTYAYDGQNRLSTVTDQRGNQIYQNTYDANGRVATQIGPDGKTTSFAYALQNPGIPTSPVTSTLVTDPLGHQTTYRFNPQGFVISVTDPSGQIRTIQRNEGNNTVTALTGAGTCSVCGDPKLGDVSYQYDINGNVLAQTDGLGHTSNFTYDPASNQITSYSDPLKNLSSFAYDSDGNLISIRDARGNAFSLAYNSFGQLASVTGPTGNATSFGYDSAGNMVSQTDALGHTIQAAYDAGSRLVLQKDAVGNSLSYTYDNLNRITALVDGLGHKTAFSYDAVGNLLGVTDPNGNQTQFQYDPKNQVVKLTDPTGKVQSYTYDGDGNYTGGVDRRGKSATFAYNALGLPVQETYTDSTVQRSYDSRGRLVSVVDSASGSFSFSYDAAGQITSNSTPLGSVSYTWDAGGRIATRTVSGRPTESYSFDPDGNLLQASMASLAVNMTYNSSNLVTSLTRSNGITGAYTYDALHRLLTDIETNGPTVIDSETYGYDSAGRRFSEAANIAQSLTTQAATGTYGADNRLTSLGTHSYTYDADGNRITDTTSAGVTNYIWDARSRLTSLTGPGGVGSSFTYDFAGNLLQQKNLKPSSTTNFIFDYLTNVVEESNTSTGSLSFLTGTGLDQAFGVLDSNNLAHFAITGKLGSVVASTDAAGSLEGRAYYEPFGQTTTSGTAFPLLYEGRVQVAPSIYYFRSRYYDASASRFLSEDPAEFVGGYNLYKFSLNDPINRIDPLGQWAGVDDAIAAGGGALVGLAGQGISDLISGKLSGWQDYVGSAAGGAAAGETLLYTANPILAGAAGGAVGNLTKQGLKNLTGKQCGFDTGSFLFDTGVGGLTGLIPGAEVPGITSGRGSWASVASQMNTKLANGTISRVSSATAGKMIGAGAVDGAFQTEAGSIAASGADTFDLFPTPGCK